MSSEDCAEAAIVLLFFSAHLQKAVNREMAQVRWANESIHRIIATTVALQKGYSFDERKLGAIRQNDAAMKLDEIRVHAQLRLDRVGFLANKVEALAKAFDGLRFAKRGQ